MTEAILLIVAAAHILGYWVGMFFESRWHRCKPCMNCEVLREVNRMADEKRKYGRYLLYHERRAMGLE